MSMTVKTDGPFEDLLEEMGGINRGDTAKEKHDDVDQDPDHCIALAPSGLDGAPTNNKEEVNGEVMVKPNMKHAGDREAH